MKKILTVIIIAAFVFSFASCKKEKPSRIITTQNPEVSTNINDETSTMYGGSTQATEPTFGEDEKSESKQNNKTTNTEPKKEQQTTSNSNLDDYGSYVTRQPIDTKENTNHKRKGIIAFSDSADNKYIKLISKKYNVSASLLAAIFTIPYEGMEAESDGNMVLRFDGSKDDKGKLIRTKDTLETIYMIDAKGDCKRLSVDGSESSDFKELQKRAILYAVKDEIMPKFQKELYS